MANSRVPPPVDLAMLLNQSSYAVANRLAAALDEVGLSVRGYCVLAKAAEGDYTQSQLSQLAFLDKTTMVNTLDELEAGGLAERTLSPTDRRVRVVAITKDGSALLRTGDRVVQGVYDEVLDGVDPANRAVFVEVLTQLVEGPLATPFHLETPVRRRRTRKAAAA
jgi:DNA-binding MarR family transcriptional regulator